MSAKIGTNIEESFIEICKTLISKNKGVKNHHNGVKKMDDPMKIGNAQTEPEGNKKKCCN